MLENKVKEVLQKRKMKEKEGGGAEMMIFRRQTYRSNICTWGVSETENRREESYQRNNTRKSPRAEDLVLHWASA